jgi:hypothetical protein
VTAPHPLRTTIVIANDSSRACALTPPATLELLNPDGTNERSLPIEMRSDVALTAQTQVPPLESGIETGTLLANVLLTWPNLPNANSLPDGDGSLICPVPLFTPDVARMEFGWNTLQVVTATEPTTSLDSGVAPIEPICGWRVQAQISAAGC